MANPINPPPIRAKLNIIHPGGVPNGIILPPIIPSTVPIILNVICDDILDSYEKTKEWLSHRVNKNIFPKNQPDFNTLSNLINRHPSIKSWQYQVPTSFKVGRSPANGAIVLYVRFDGAKSYRIVSWVACAKGKLAKHQETGNIDNQLNGAMRYAIRRQINNYKSANGNIICCLCGSAYRIEVDHHPIHFVDIKNNYIKANVDKLPPNEFNWHPKKGNFMFKNGTKANDYYDKKWKQSWQRYHQKYAQYRYLCSTCNKKNNQPDPSGLILT